MLEINETMVSQNALREIILLLNPEKAEICFAILREDAKLQKAQHAEDMKEAHAIIAQSIEQNFPMMKED